MSECQVKVKSSRWKLRKIDEAAISHFILLSSFIILHISHSVGHHGQLLGYLPIWWVIKSFNLQTTQTISRMMERKQTFFHSFLRVVNLCDFIVNFQLSHTAHVVIVVKLQSHTLWMCFLLLVHCSHEPWRQVELSVIGYCVFFINYRKPNKRTIERVSVTLELYHWTETINNVSRAWILKLLSLSIVVGRSLVCWLWYWLQVSAVKRPTWKNISSDDYAIQENLRYVIETCFDKLFCCLNDEKIKNIQLNHLIFFLSMCYSWN